MIVFQVFFVVFGILACYCAGLWFGFSFGVSLFWVGGSVGLCIVGV